jgi:hypothetical protein
LLEDPTRRDRVVEDCVKLFAAFAKSVTKNESFNW